MGFPVQAALGPASPDVVEENPRGRVASRRPIASRRGSGSRREDGARVDQSWRRHSKIGTAAHSDAVASSNRRPVARPGTAEAPMHQDLTPGPDEQGALRAPSPWSRQANRATRGSARIRAIALADSTRAFEIGPIRSSAAAANRMPGTAPRTRNPRIGKATQPRGRSVQIEDSGCRMRTRHAEIRRPSQRRPG